MKIKATILSVIAAMLFSLPASAELWTDYDLSREVTELTVVEVKPNYVDTYLTRLESTWITSMEIQKELGYVVDFNVWVAPVAAQPNVFLTVTYPDMGAMQGSKERYDTVNKMMEERYEDDEEEQQETARGYEEYREMVDYVILNRVIYK